MPEYRTPNSRVWDLLYTYQKGYRDRWGMSPAEKLAYDHATGTPTMSAGEEQRLIRREAGLRAMSNRAAVEGHEEGDIQDACQFLADFPSLRDPDADKDGAILQAIRHDADRAEQEQMVLARLAALREALCEGRVEDPFAEKQAA